MVFAHPSPRPKRAAPTSRTTAIAPGTPNNCGLTAIHAPRQPHACNKCTMAPTKPREQSVERTQEYEDFLDTLEKYHEKRGWVVCVA